MSFDTVRIARVSAILRVLAGEPDICPAHAMSIITDVAVLLAAAVDLGVATCADILTDHEAVLAELVDNLPKVH